MPPKLHLPSTFRCCRGVKCLTGCRMKTKKKDGQEYTSMEHAGDCPCSVGRGGKRPGAGRATSTDHADADESASKKSKPQRKKPAMEYERMASSSQPSSSSACDTPVETMEEDDGDDVLSDNDIDTMLLMDLPKYKV